MQANTILGAACVSILLSASLLPAQGKCYFIPDNTKSGSNVIPFGSTLGSIGTWGKQKYQMLVHSTDVSGALFPIDTLAIGGAGSGMRRFESINIKMDYFQGVGTTMSTTFASNMTATPTTVLDAKNYSFVQTGGAWSYVGLQNTFLYFPSKGHLVIEITVTGAYFEATTGSAGLYNAGTGSAIVRQRLYARAWTTTNPPASGTLGSTAAIRVKLCHAKGTADVFGTGCKGSNGKTPTVTFAGGAKIGQNLTVGLIDALPSTGGFVALGITSLVPSFELPGAPGCHLHQIPAEVIGIGTSATGTFSVVQKVPNAPGIRLSVQFLIIDPLANKAAGVFSNVGRILIGT